MVAANVSTSLAAADPTVAKVTIEFNTTGDGKDGDTQVLDRLVINGRDFAKLECCSSGNHGEDVWQHGSINTKEMKITSPMKKSDLANAEIIFGMRPNGHDKWEFKPTLKVVYDDNTNDQWTFEQFYLESDNKYTERTFTIPKH